MSSMATTSDQAQAAFRALADPTRRDILFRLSDRDMTIGEVVDQYEITRAAVKKHLIILEDGGLISVRSNGRERINQLEPLGLKYAADWFDHFNHFWSERLEKLKSVVEKTEEKKQPKRKSERKTP